MNCWPTATLPLFSVEYDHCAHVMKNVSLANRAPQRSKAFARETI
jgi:hypothetical protein